MADDSQSRASIPKPIGQFGSRFLKFADKKLQQGINFLDSHHHISSSDPPPPLPPPPPPSSSSVNPPHQPLQTSYYFPPPQNNVSAPLHPPPPPPVNPPQNPNSSSNSSSSFSLQQPPPPPVPVNVPHPSPYNLPQNSTVSSNTAAIPPPQVPPSTVPINNAPQFFPNNLPQTHTHNPSTTVTYPLNDHQPPFSNHLQNPTTSSNVSATLPPQPPLPNAPPIPQQHSHQYNHYPNTTASFNPPQPQNPLYTPSNTPFIRPQRPAHAPILNSNGPIFTEDLLLQMQTRLFSATKALGSPAVTEARKGLSRVLTPTYDDIELFGYQLKTCQVIAVESNWNTLDDQLPCFAISYVQHPPQGRYKFSDHQWQNLHAVVEAIAQAGVAHFRLWLDQCLWLRDASQPSWVHSGILPYVLWPVVALGAKHSDGERTTDSFERMWPFVEQVSGLWGMGVVVASEYRSRDTNAGMRSWLTYNLRLRTEPERNLMIILLNVFHGAIDDLKTGWVEDVQELREMAVTNIMHNTDDIIIGSNWRQRFVDIEPLRCSSVLDRVQLPRHCKDYDEGENMYVDGSRRLKSTRWQGVKEWFSGNEGSTQWSDRDIRRFCDYDIRDKYNIITDNGEFQLLKGGGRREVIWLLVAMQGRSSYFSRGRVAWTKVVSGPSSCKLGDILENGTLTVLQRVLGEQVGEQGSGKVRIISLNNVSSEIEWV